MQFDEKERFQIQRKFINTKVKMMDGSATGIGSHDGISRESRIAFLKPIVNK